MRSNEAAFALGLAQKAGKVASGYLAVTTALKKGKACLMLLANDAAASSRKELVAMAESMSVPVVEPMTRAELGQAIGKAERAAVIITDQGFAKMIQSKL